VALHNRLEPLAGLAHGIVHPLTELLLNLPPKASQVMVSTTFPPPLLGCVFSAKKWHTSFQHAVKNDQHMMSHRDNRALLARLGASR
jgi:hypothetical protein